MLTDEQAKERLKPLLVDWRTVAKKRTGRLPKADGEAVRVLSDLALKIKTNATRDWNARQREEQKRLAKAAAHLDQLSEKRRVATFTAILPKLGLHVERAWQSFKHSTYSYQLAFRCPSAPEVTGPARSRWFENLAETLARYDQDAVWLAQWAPYIAHYHYGDVVGRLLAAVIDGGGDEGDRVLQTLIDSANGEHEIGAMGRHVTTALMSCSRPEAWDYVEKLLLAAQRQEGLRQSILEAIDLAHPGAFRRMLRLILEHKLVRFASVVRAAEVWFALRWDSASARVIKQAIERSLLYLDDHDARAQALSGDHPEEAYMALWAIAFEDSSQAIPAAKPLLKHAKPEMRFAAAWLLSLLNLPEASKTLLPLVDDEDLGLVNLGLSSLVKSIHNDNADESAYKTLVKLAERLPKKKTKLKPLLWPWLQFTIQRSEAADLLPRAAAEADWPYLIDHLPHMGVHGRYQIVRLLEERKTPLPPGTRALLLELTGDLSSDVRNTAVKLLGQQKPTADEAQQLESLLTRKAGDLRRGVLRLLAKQADAAALDSATRLVASKSKPQRLAGLELVRTLHEAKRSTKKCRTLAETYAAERAPLGDDEQVLINPVVGVVRETPKFDDVFGLLNASKLTPSVPLKNPKATLLTKAAGHILNVLDDLVHAHRETTVTVGTWEGEKEVLLGNAGALRRHRNQGKTDTCTPFPLKEVWLDWRVNRPKNCCDCDGFEFVRALALTSFINYQDDLFDASGLASKVYNPSDIKKLRYAKQVVELPKLAQCLC